MRTFEATRSGRVPGSTQGPLLNMAHLQKVTVVVRAGSDRALASSFSGQHLSRRSDQWQLPLLPSHSSRAGSAHPRTALSSQHLPSNKPPLSPLAPRPTPDPCHPAASPNTANTDKHATHAVGSRNTAFNTIDLAPSASLALLSHTTSVLISLVSPNLLLHPRLCNRTALEYCTVRWNCTPTLPPCHSQTTYLD
jgi:hypothetical protein